MSAGDRRATKRRLAGLLFLFYLLTALPSTAQSRADFSPEEYAQRRSGVLQQMPEQSLAVFQAASVKMRSNDVEYEYRQNSNFLYLTGVNEPGGFLVLVKDDSATTHEILFLRRVSGAAASWVGESLSFETAARLSGVADVRSAERFAAVVDSLLPGRQALYVKFKPDFFYEPVSGERFFIGRKVKKLLQEKYPGLKIKSPGKFVARLRQVKSPAEIRLLRRAIDITCRAQVEAMRAARPGLFEYQLEAVIEYVFKLHGALAPAFPSIIGSGPNATVLHYSRNTRQTVGGDLVVMDIGAEYHGYSADVTRTIPINGRFSKEQREIYEIVLRAQKAAMNVIRPGVPFKTVHQTARKVIEEAGYGKYFIHGTSHFLGLDTHDVSASRKELQPGMVLTVEPGIYIPAGSEVDSTYWNIGVRIEDDVLVTEDGYELLSAAAPREVEAIEKLMREESRVPVELR